MPIPCYQFVKIMNPTLESFIYFIELINANNSNLDDDVRWINFDGRIRSSSGFAPFLEDRSSFCTDIYSWVDGGTFNLHMSQQGIHKHKWDNQPKCVLARDKKQILHTYIDKCWYQNSLKDLNHSFLNKLIGPEELRKRSQLV